MRKDEVARASAQLRNDDTTELPTVAEDAEAQRTRRGKAQHHKPKEPLGTFLVYGFLKKTTTP